MKIIIISAAAPPEPIVAGRVHWDMAEYLATKGNETWLISPYPSRPLGNNYPGKKEDQVANVCSGFYHVNVNSFTYPKYNLFLRIYESFSFGLRSIRYLNRKIRTYDILYVSSWPFIGQLIILLLKKNKKAPLIMNVQDLYPESFFTKMNSAIINKFFRPLYLVDRFIARRSNHLTVVSNTLKEVYLRERKIDESRISILFNWQDESEFLKPIPEKEIILSRYNLDRLQNKFVFMFLGNIGPVAGVEIIIKAFSQLNNPDCMLVIAGSGTQKEKCIALSKELGADNILFTGVPNGLSPVVEMQSISDILLLPIDPEAAHSSIPSKLIAYMFSGKPVITSAHVKSETAKAIKESECGWITGSNEIAEWVKYMDQAFRTKPELLKAKGKAGFEYAIHNYSKKEGLRKTTELFTYVIESNK